MSKRALYLLMPVLLFLLAVLTNGCQKDDTDFAAAEEYGSEVAHKWFDLTRKITKETPGFSPPVASRAYAYTAVALYEAVESGATGYHSLGGQINGLSASAVTKPLLSQEYQWDIVANSCLAEITRKLYAPATAANLSAIDSLELALEQAVSANATQEVIDRSVSYGKLVATEIYNYSVTDGQDKGYLSNFPATYTPPTGDGFWVPTPPAFQKAMQPYWGNVRPFISANVTNTQPQDPIPFSEDPASAFYAQSLEVFETVTNLTPEQEQIANFWSDDPGKTGTPPGHSIAIATQALRAQNASLILAAETYAKIGMAVHDAFVSCWRCKYHYNLMRPVTYIQQYINPDFTSLLTTPPFPEYTSGHSVQSGASSVILSEIFGYNYAFNDSTHVLRTDIDGTPRHFNSFYEAADEAAISRLYGGIHYRQAIDEGILQGRKIGENISQMLNFKD
ncbi:phosphatase PAP2 family protein [Sphingobacteriales bacterium UPWRP_1]|nr:hypothetical protein BVG80_15440 [Sphingobacteriales bacterium TSM_CSM]PSJ79140.1 phosphatase PAP2 family protein [Sphingobacteriales bacterium UPWRP_1]